MKPRISVVVLTKNEGRFIGACLRSLKKQELQPEIIVVDGHSTDGTIEICKELADKVVFDEEKGFAYARNLGWKTASADIVAYCDADSRIPKKWTKKIYGLLTCYEAISGPLVPYDGAHRLRSTFRFWACDVPVGLSTHLHYQSLWGANMAFRKDVLAREPFKFDVADDYELGRRLKKKGYDLLFTPELRAYVSSRRFGSCYGFYKVCTRHYLLDALKLKVGKGNRISKTYWK